MKGFAVYYLLDPRTTEPRYVGYSRCPHSRFKWHCTGHLRYLYLDSHKIRWIKTLQAVGTQPILSIRSWFELEEAKRVEFELIEKLRARGVDLTNTAPGGTGGDTFTQNVNREITREKHRQNTLRKYQDPVERQKTGNATRGCVRSEEARERYRQSWTDERRQKIAEMAHALHSGRKRPLSTIQKIAANHVGMLGRKHTEETKAKMRAARARRKKSSCAA